MHTFQPYLCGHILTTRPEALLRRSLSVPTSVLTHSAPQCVVCRPGSGPGVTGSAADGQQDLPLDGHLDNVSPTLGPDYHGAGAPGGARRRCLVAHGRPVRESFSTSL